MGTFQSQPGQPGNGASEQRHRGDGPGLGQRVDQINDTAHQLLDEARGVVADVSQTLDLRGRVERHPYGTLLAAAGIGYVLGGGLFTPLTGRLLRLGFRLAMLPFVKDELIGMAEAAVAGMVQGQRQDEEPPGTPDV